MGKLFPIGKEKTVDNCVRLDIITIGYPMPYNQIYHLFPLLGKGKGTRWNIKEGK